MGVKRINTFTGKEPLLLQSRLKLKGTVCSNTNQAVNASLKKHHHQAEYKVAGTICTIHKYTKIREVPSYNICARTRGIGRSRAGFVRSVGFWPQIGFAGWCELGGEG
jgi:hypothetical protein